MMLVTTAPQANVQWFYDGHVWHSQQQATYDPVQQTAVPQCRPVPLPAIHLAYDLGQGRRCRVCEAKRQEQGG